MMLSRRRFLTIAAAFAAGPACARPHQWQGRAFGAEIALTMHGPHRRADRAIAQARRLIAEVEHTFSLFDPGSALSRLNQTGTAPLTAHLVEVFGAADRAHARTGGLFDPSVQPVWAAIVSDGDPDAARARVGWHRVTRERGRITLGPGQALTFNGIAQGYATDLVTDMLTAHGFERLLVNIGEYRGTGGPWRLGLEDPVHGLVGQRTLTKGAIATSSPAATPIGADGHILHGHARPQWSSVSVEAETATMADALSTGLVLAGPDRIRRVAAAADVRRITLVDARGDVLTV